MNKFRNKYRISSTRLQNWDYGTNGAYFITICTQNREHFFGNVINNEMQLSELGQLAEKFWLVIPNHFTFIELGNFVIMPNHTHGILIVNNTVETGFIPSLEFNNETETVLIPSEFIETELIRFETETGLIPSLPKNEKTGGFAGNKNPMFHQNISQIIRWYKGRCSFEIRKFNSDFNWQPRFHDHIIRNEQSFEKIQNYIDNNPANWEKDKFY